MKPVAIIGGGITGLTAAFFLKKQGIPVVLYEAAHRVGGVVQSVRRDGYLAEFGPNSILETSPVISELVRGLGLESRRIYSNPSAENRYVVRRRKPVVIPNSAAGFLKTPLFSFPAKLRVLAEPFIPPAPDGVEESIAQFVQRRLGQEFLDYAIDPLVAGIYAGDPRQLSVTQAFPKLHAVEQRYRSLFVGQVLGARERKRSGEVSKQNAKKFSFDDGLQVLIDALQARLADEIETSTPIHGLRRAEEGWSVELEQGVNSAPVKCSAVLLALPSHKIASLEFKTVPALDVSPLARIYYPPVASVVLGFRRAEVAHPLDGFGMLIPEKEGFKILGAIFSSSLFPHRAPEGEVAITCYIGGARAGIAAENIGRVGGNRRAGPARDFRRAGAANVSARHRFWKGHSPIQSRVRQIPGDDERHGSQSSRPLCGRPRARRRLAGRFHGVRPQERRENSRLSGFKP